MPEPLTRPVTAPAVSRAALRIVLFGMPDAGKSSLLGALAQAAQTQEHVLNGHLTDLGQGLAELQRRLYEDQSRTTLGEVIPFPIAFESFPARERGPSERFQAVLIDCEGQKALDLMTRWRSYGPQSNLGALGQAILDADAIILTVDAAASPAQIETDFAEFTRFLHTLEHSRGQRTEVGGLPVFLVLTKCDLLAGPDDDLSGWMDRIEERKRELGRRFEGFLRRDAHQGFGSLNLHLWATAIKRPALKESPARPRDPYGVAELFRQCFDEARSHRRRRGQSSFRLLLTVAGVFAAVALLAALGTMLFFIRPGLDVAELENRVSHLQAREQDQSPQARHKNLKNKIDELEDVLSNAAFPRLPPPKQEYVEHRLKELTAYREFEKSIDKIPDPRTARRESQLDEIKEKLLGLIPADYQVEWSQTEPGQRRAALLDDVQAIETAVQTVLDGYNRLVKSGKQVLDESSKPNLPSRARKVLDDAKAVPDPKNDQTKLIPGSERVTYATVFAYSRVHDLVRQWDEEIKEKLAFAASLKTN